MGGTGVLDDVPVALPALTRAVKLQHKAAKVGFDWPSLAPVFAKAKEEIGELEEAIADGLKPDGAASEAVTEEFGDLLFVMANVARHLKIDPEAALRAANAKFVRRFRRIEVAARRRRPHALAVRPSPKWTASGTRRRRRNASDSIVIPG